MTNLQNKYKDKLPEETIINVKQFFESKNYNIEVVQIYEPIPNIWWCHINLKYNNIIILSANGKGTSENFALASGYSELYERYCNFCGNILGQKINQEKLFSLNFIKNGYKLFPDEKYIGLNEIKNTLPVLNDYYNSIEDDNFSFEKYINKYYPEGILALPFKGFNNNKTINLPFNLLLISNGSSGMAAGNTIEEALTQGLSEICEHYVHNQIYKNKEKIFYCLNIDNISDLPVYIKTYFQNLTSKGYQYYLYDFSYTYQMPVLGLYIIDPKTHLSYLNLGAAPIFTIALERCCTEIYQGHTTLGDNVKKVMLPFRSNDIEDIIESTVRTLAFSTYYPDELIFNKKEVEKYNDKIFLKDNNYSNIELNNYFKTLFNYKKWEVYYRDLSQSNNIKAIKCYVNNIPIMDHITNKSKTASTLLRKRKWDIIFKWESLIDEYFKTQNVNNSLLSEILSLKQSIPKNEIVTFEGCFNTDFLHMPNEFSNNNSFFNFNFFMDAIMTKNWNLIFNNPNNFKELRFYLILILYAEHYSKEEIIKISQFYGINYIEKDLDNRKNLGYILDKIYFSPGYNYYYSNDYEKLMETYIPLV